MVFYNSTDYIGAIINGINNITGSLFITLFMMMIVLIIIALALNLPIEITGFIYLPILIAVASFSSDYLAIFGVTLVYLGIIIGKNLLRTN